MKVIFHLDLDSYFVSAQRTINKSLINKPVVISGGHRRSVIVAASYEAKSIGIKVPMPYFKAKEICPNLISIKPNFALYTVLSTKLFEFISKRYTKNIEVASIDECYIDASDIWQKYGSPAKLAQQMQKDIKQELSLPSSFGISNNKFVAKMSTQINKPNGITITKPGEFLKKFGEWKLIKYHGIGKPTAIKLNSLGIYKIKDLAQSSVSKIQPLLGIVSTKLIEQAKGMGDDKVDTSYNELKGIGNSVTFQEKDTDNRNEIMKILENLVKMVSIRANNRNVVGSTVSISIKEKGGKDIKAISKQTSLNVPINKYDDILQIAINLFDELWDNNIIKFIGVHLGKLENMFEATYQTTIFDQPKEIGEIQKIMNEVNRKFKSEVVTSGIIASKKISKEKNQSRYLESDRILKYYDKK